MLYTLCVTEVSVVKHVCHRGQCCQACVSQRSVLSSQACVLQRSVLSNMCVAEVSAVKHKAFCALCVAGV